MKRKPTCGDPNSMSSSSTGLDLAKERTEGGSKRRGLIASNRWAANLAASLKSTWKGIVLTGQISVNISSVTRPSIIKGWALSTFWTQIPCPKVTSVALSWLAEAPEHTDSSEPTVTQSVWPRSRPNNLMLASRWPWFGISPRPGGIPKLLLSLPSASGIGSWLSWALFHLAKVLT